MWDMLAAARDALAVVHGLTDEALLQERVRMLALERALEILGEAAGRVSPDLQGQHPAIAWRALKGQRNIIAHEYGRIDHRLLLRSVQERLPELVTHLERLLANT